MDNSAVSALILCTDDQCLDTIRHALGESAITSEPCSTSGAALDALKEKDFDLLALDFGEPGATALMDAWISRGPNSSKVAIALARHGELLRAAQQKFAHFVLQKPLDKRIVSKTLKIAYNMILKHRRADYRHSVNIKAEATAIDDDGAERKLKNVVLLDISQGGACLKVDALMNRKVTVNLAFHLPETHELVRVTGKFTWNEPGGVVGLKFTSVPAGDLKKLQTWLDARNPLTPKAAVVDNPYHVREGLDRTHFRV